MLIWKIYIKACQTSNKIRSRVSSPPKKTEHFLDIVLSDITSTFKHHLCPASHSPPSLFFWAPWSLWLHRKKNNNCQTFVSWDELDQVTIGDVMLGYTPVILWPEHPECNDDNDATVDGRKSQTTTLVDLKPCKLWKRTIPIKWCRISSIKSYHRRWVFWQHFPHSFQPTGDACLCCLPRGNSCIGPFACKRMSLVLLELMPRF